MSAYVCPTARGDPEWRGKGGRCVVSKSGEAKRVRSYAGLELVAAELMDEQPAIAAQVRAKMREMIELGGLRPVPAVRLVVEADEERALDARSYVS